MIRKYVAALMGWLRRDKAAATQTGMFDTFVEWDSAADHNAYRSL